MYTKQILILKQQFIITVFEYPYYLIIVSKKIMIEAMYIDLEIIYI